MYIGILANKWRIFHRPLDVNIEFCDSIVKACCMLHNYVRIKDGIRFTDTCYECPLQNIPSSYMRGTASGTAIRDYFSSYFTSVQGCVTWQYDQV